MANKITGPKSIARGLTIKFVKKANMWVATFPRDGKTLQEWFTDKPTKEQINSILEHGKEESTN